MNAIDHIMDERDSLRRELQRLEVSITKVMLEREELRHLSRQLETMNEAVIEARKAAVAQNERMRNALKKIAGASMELLDDHRLVREIAAAALAAVRVEDA